MLANGRVVGTSEVMHLRDDFTLDFRDVFTVRLLKWPDSMQLQLWEKGTFRDTMLAEFYLVVPGLAGTPHVDPQPKPYSWTSPHPVPHHMLPTFQHRDDLVPFICDWWVLSAIICSKDLLISLTVIILQGSVTNELQDIADTTCVLALADVNHLEVVVFCCCVSHNNTDILVCIQAVLLNCV
eukprot:GHRR01022950.1.p1 GENE.GHRR01022950.1~~GHRR01022950.1.p1  ORF type:complete len:211 (+),score=25.69 GHRR01022950.1:89-634(+)